MVNRKIIQQSNKKIVKTFVIIGLVTLLVIINTGLQNNHSSVSAQPSSWPTSWKLIRTDANNDCGGTNTGNVSADDELGKTVYDEETAMVYVYISGLSSISNFVWLDENGNGTQDAGENGIGGVIVGLYDDSDPPNFIKQTTTDSNGQYILDGLSAGTYRLRFTPPAGYTFTLQYIGSDTTIDSNPDSEGWTQLITLGGEENNPTIDAGLIRQKELPSTPAQVPVLTPAGTVLLVGALSLISVIMIRKKRK